MLGLITVSMCFGEVPEILQATYGAGSEQMDVTTQMKSLVQSNQTNVRVGNHLFGKDPAFGRMKTLDVIINSNGIQQHVAIREGHPLSFANAAPSEQPKTVQPASPPEPRLAPERTYFLIASTGLVKDTALIGLHAGTAVKVIHDNGGTFHVSWENTELDIDKGILTNDLNVVEAAVKRDQQSQAAVASWKTEQQNVQRTQDQKAHEEQQKAYEESAREMDKTETFRTWSSSSASQRKNSASANSYHRIGPGRSCGREKRAILPSGSLMAYRKCEFCIRL